MSEAADELVPGTILEGLPIFPLPNLVFFPRTMLPLHVFEPRYLAMTKDVLEGNGLMGVVRLPAGWEADYEGKPALSEVFGLGQIVRQDQDEEGRVHIFVRGIARARIVEEQPTDQLYRTVRAEILEEKPGASAGQLATVRQLFASMLGRMEGADLESASVLFNADLPPALLLDAIATAAPLPPELKQTLLDECDEAVRADSLAELLATWVMPGASLE